MPGLAVRRRAAVALVPTWVASARKKALDAVDLAPEPPTTSHLGGDGPTRGSDAWANNSPHRWGRGTMTLESSMSPTPDPEAQATPEASEAKPAPSAGGLAEAGQPVVPAEAQAPEVSAPFSGIVPGESSRRRSPEATLDARFDQVLRELEGLNAKLSLLQGRVDGITEAAGSGEASAAEARALMAQLSRGQGRTRAWAMGLGAALAISVAALAGVLLGAVGPALQEAREAHQLAKGMAAEVADAKQQAEDAKVQLAQLQPRIDQALRAPLAATAALEGRAKGVLAQGKISLKQASAADLDFPKAKQAYLDARRLFELAASLDPKDPEAPLGLGMALVGLGEVELAREAWRRAMELGLTNNRPDVRDEALKRLSSLGAFSLPLPQKSQRPGATRPSPALPPASLSAPAQLNQPGPGSQSLPALSPLPAFSPPPEGRPAGPQRRSP